MIKAQQDFFKIIKLVTLNFLARLVCHTEGGKQAEGVREVSEEVIRMI